MNRTQFIQAHALACVLATLGTGITPELALVQAILESNNGNSTLSTKYNNYYGIKSAGNWKGKSVNLRTFEYYNGVKTNITDGFRVYGSFYGSCRDWVKFLKSYSRYKDTIEAPTPIDQMIEIGRSGYATAPTYSSTLISIYKANKTTIDSALSGARFKIASGTVVVSGLMYYLYAKRRRL